MNNVALALCPYVLVVLLDQLMSQTQNSVEASTSFSYIVRVQAASEMNNGSLPMNFLPERCFVFADNPTWT